LELRSKDRWLLEFNLRLADDSRWQSLNAKIIVKREGNESAALC
jgi:hypothetical protein